MLSIVSDVELSIAWREEELVKDKAKRIDIINKANTRPMRAAKPLLYSCLRILLIKSKVGATGLASRLIVILSAAQSLGPVFQRITA